MATSSQAPWSVQVPLVGVFLAGFAAIALGVRTKGDDTGYHGLVQMLLGVAVCVLATAIKNGSRDARTLLIVLLAGGAVMSVFQRDVSTGTKLLGMAGCAAVTSLLTFPLASRLWFGDVEPDDDGAELAALDE